MTSVTTVGYGDKAFKTLYGRVFASVWLLVSTLAVARAFLFLAEARIDKRHRRIVKWILHRDLTVDDLLAADLNRNGFIRYDRQLCLPTIITFFFYIGMIFLTVGQHNVNMGLYLTSCS